MSIYLTSLIRCCLKTNLVSEKFDLMIVDVMMKISKKLTLLNELEKGMFIEIFDESVSWSGAVVNKIDQNCVRLSNFY